MKPAERVYISATQEGLYFSLSRSTYRLSFSKRILEVVYEAPELPNGVECYGVLGKVDIGPGYLIIITSIRKVVVKPVDIYRVQDVAFIPLVYEDATKILENLVVEEATPDEILDGTSISSGDSISESLESKSSWKWKRQHTGLNAPSLTVKFIKWARIYFQKDFYYSYDIDLTHSLEAEIYAGRRSEGSQGSQTSHTSNAPNTYHMTAHIAQEFQNTPLYLPVIQGFVGSSDIHFKDIKTPGTLLILSRRSNKRVGVRYLRRGIDDEGNCANWVKTEQFIHHEQFGCACYSIVRGSMPLYFSQSPYKLQSRPKLSRAVDETLPVTQMHFQKLKRSLGQVTVISLVEKPPSFESEVGRAYYELAAKCDKLPFEWFDFHSVCKGMKFENVNLLFSGYLVQQALNEYGWSDERRGLKQRGVFRVNCIDCLDRTNVVQSHCAKHILQKQLDSWHVEISDVAKFEVGFKTLWADNGDAISRQYSSTAALKGDFTRTGQRKYKGVLTDAFLTLSRYYYGTVTDFFAQASLDYITGNIDEHVFDEFEQSLRSGDPANEVKNAQDIALSLARDLVNDNEDLIGSWWLQTPVIPGDETKIKKQLRDCGLLVTNKAVYFCFYNDSFAKVVNFVRVPGNAIHEIQYGDFYGEIVSQISRDSKRNRGFILRYPFGAGVHASKSKLESKDDLLNWFVAFKIPLLIWKESDAILASLREACPNAKLVNKEIVTLEDAKSETSIWDVLEYKMKRAVWA